MRYSQFHLCFLLLLSWFFLCIPSTHELQAAHTQVLLQLKKYLENPTSLEIWENYNGDFCFISPSARMSIKCEGNSVTELKIMGDKPVRKVKNFNGLAIPNQTLSHSFSIDSFFTTLVRLSSLRVLSLVSLGIWGSLPDKIHRLSSLQILDLSSNFLYGSIPPKISTMVKLHTLTLNTNRINTTMPNWLGSLSNLHSLSLNSNHLKGSLPSSLCKIKTLTDISLSHNQLSGELPNLSALTALRVLNLGQNHFDSKLPLMPKSLVTLLLNENSFSGNIPNHFGKLIQLQHLDLSSNHLSGTPPSSLFSLPNITYINLASNVLSGSLPFRLTCGTKLGYVDISSNKLNGELPSCLARAFDTRVVKYGGNCLSVDSKGSDQHQKLGGSYCKKPTKKKIRTLKLALVIMAIMVGFVLLVSFVFGVFFCRKRHRLRKTSKQDMLTKSVIVPDNSRTGVSSEILASARLISQALKLGTQANLVCRLFSIEELKEATNDFDLSTYMGEGSIGKLYKGKLVNGSHVAIRSLALSKKCSIQNLKSRLDILSKLQHPNLVSLLGHCMDVVGQDDSSVLKLHLIYEYVPNGNYRSHLLEISPEKALKWSDRLTILIGVAKAVHFLHTGVIPGCYNNKLKTNNILLDEHHIPKLSDYGMSIFREDIENLEAKGESPLSCQRTTMEDDVYNLGFILFESLVGTIATEKREHFFLNEKASFGSQDGRRKIVDPLVLTTCCQESLSIVISITTKCISPEPSSRPSFEDVLWNLQYAAQVQAIADSDQKSE